MTGKRLARASGQRPALRKSTARGPNIEEVIISEADLDFFRIGMWNNLTVLDLFTDQEIDRLCEPESSATLLQISYISKLFFWGQLSTDDDNERLCDHPSAAEILKQTHRITFVSDAPLPALGGSARSQRKSYPWTGAENLRLLVVVARFRARNWRTIALFVGAGRSPS
jgi:hypothetical protein